MNRKTRKIVALLVLMVAMTTNVMGFRGPNFFKERIPLIEVESVGLGLEHYHKAKLIKSTPQKWTYRIGDSLVVLKVDEKTKMVKEVNITITSEYETVINNLYRQWMMDLKAFNNYEWTGGETKVISNGKVIRTCPQSFISLHPDMGNSYFKDVLTQVNESRYKAIIKAGYRQSSNKYYLTIIIK
jgi:mRNA-degrading endonuclease RelE of RelBE toxin-antitoxin system